MSGNSIIDFISPFQNISDYFKAIEIVNQLFSQYSKNYNEISLMIKKIINIILSDFEIKKFINKINMFPAHYGLDYVKQTTILHQQIHDTAAQDNNNTIVLTPAIADCMFCPTTKLIHNKHSLSHVPMLYSSRGIGNYFNFLIINLIKFLKKY